MIICRLPARDHFFTQGIIASIRAQAKFSLSKYIYMNGKTVVCSYTRLLPAFQTDQQSCAITYIASNYNQLQLEMSQSPASHQLFVSSQSAPCITLTLIDTCNRITPTRILHGFILSSSTFMMFCLRSFIHSCDHVTFREY